MENSEKQSAHSKPTSAITYFQETPYLPLLLVTFTFYLTRYDLREIVTPDEFAWVIQSIHFRQALIEQDWPRLVQSAHPGFITMWLGSIGTTVKLWLQPNLQTEINWILQQSWHLPQSGELSARLHPFLQPARNTLSLFMAGLWAAAYALLKQRTGAITAILTVLILITDMWIVGLTNILHVDGLLAMFCLLTLLLVLPRRDNELAFYGRQRYLLAGIAIAGAVLSKVPGLLLLAVVPTILIMQMAVGAQRAAPTHRVQHAGPLRAVFLPVLIGFVCTLAILAPIIFINPNHVFQNVFVLSAREVGFSSPTFFLGQVTEKPGILFYPLTILFRQRAIITIGLIIGLVQLIRGKNGRKQLFFITSAGAFCLLFWLGLLISDREFARYALPIYLLFSLAGALSISVFIQERLKANDSSRITLILAGAMAVLTIITPFFYEKDPFVFINPLFGGSWNDSNLMLTGWGGGQSTVAEDIFMSSSTYLLTDNVPATAPFVDHPDRVFLFTPQTAWLLKPTDLLILSKEYQQLNPDHWNQASTQLPAGHRGSPTRYLGADRAWLFSSFEQSLLDHGLSRYTSAGFDFNASLRLTEAIVIQPDDDFNIHLLMLWQTSQPEDGILQFTITDSADNVWIQREDPLINIEDISAAAWTPNTNYLSIHSLPLASDMPPGNYSVHVSHFRPDGSLSGITQANEFIGTTATLATFPVTVPAPQPPVAMPENSLNHPIIKAVSELPAVIGQGETVTADVWLKNAPSTLTLSVGEDAFNFPLDTNNWQDDFIYRIRGRWQIPADSPPGDHPIRLNDIDLGTLTVEARERNFDIPADIPAEALTFGNVLKLIAIEPKLAEQNSIRIVWQTIEPDQVDYTIFIHLKDAAGNMLAQQDRPPGKPTSQTVSGEVIDFTVEIPLGSIDPADVSTIAIGFYNPATGQRLTVLDPSGTRLPNDQAEIVLGESRN